VTDGKRKHGYFLCIRNLCDTERQTDEQAKAAMRPIRMAER